MLSCSLQVFMQKIIFTVKKIHKIVASRAALFGSDINQIVWRLRDTLQTPLGELIALPQTP